MARTAEKLKIRRVVGAAASPRDSVVYFEESGVSAAWGLALVPGAGQDKASGSRGDGSCISMAWLADLAIALGLCEFGAAQLQLAFAGLDGGFFTVRALVDVDLDRGLGRRFEISPGGAINAGLFDIPPGGTLFAKLFDFPPGGTFLNK